MSKKGPKELPSTYLFAQQRDSSCMLMPFINYAILREQQDPRGTLRYLDREWHTKEEWFIKTFPALRDWHLALRKLSFPRPGENNAFAQLQMEMLEHGLLKENISSLTLTNNQPYVAGDDIEDVLKLFLTPYTSSITDKVNMLTKFVPILYDNGKFYCYDTRTNDFIPITATPTALAAMKRKEVVQFRDLKIPPHLHSFYQLSDKDFLLPGGSGFGREQVMKASYADPDFKYISERGSGYFYEAGLYTLMLFAMGVDKNNNPITPQSELYPAYQNFKQVMAEFPNNPWNSPDFKKENFLEYHIAEILKANPEFKTRMQAMLREFTAWPYFKALEKTHQGEKIKQYLCGNDQMMAYAISQYLKLLWAASLSKEKLIAVTDFGTLDKDLTEDLDLDMIMGKILQDAQVKDQSGKSFLDYWDEMKVKLTARVGANANLVSFDGHGSIKSFNPSVCEAQAHYGLAQPHLYRRLGYTELDSFYQEGTQPFYQRTQEEAARMEESALVIQRAWRERQARKRKPLEQPIRVPQIPKQTSAPKAVVAKAPTPAQVKAAEAKATALAKAEQVKKAAQAKATAAKEAQQAKLKAQAETKLVSSAKTLAAQEIDIELQLKALEVAINAASSDAQRKPLLAQEKALKIKQTQLQAQEAKLQTQAVSLFGEQVAKEKQTALEQAARSDFEAKLVARSRPLIVQEIKLTKQVQALEATGKKVPAVLTAQQAKLELEGRKLQAQAVALVGEEKAKEKEKALEDAVKAELEKPRK